MRYGIITLIILFFVIVVVAVFIGSGNQNSGTKNPARITRLATFDHKDGASVSWTVQGRLIGEDKRTAVRVTVTRGKRNVELLSGYEERVERNTELPNSPAAFETFVRALDNVGFGKERTVKMPDERGVCPLGNRFVYRLTDNGSEVMRTWSDTCAATDGPFGGGSSAAQVIQQLFRAQIPDYNKFIIGVQL